MGTTARDFKVARVLLKGEGKTCMKDNVAKMLADTFNRSIKN